MQAANVHAILESGPLVHKVQVRLNDSIGLIDDLDETLAIFDLKLRHMREDIAAIEARNNRCSPVCAPHLQQQAKAELQADEAQWLTCIAVAMRKSQLNSSCHALSS